MLAFVLGDWFPPLSEGHSVRHTETEMAMQKNDQILGQTDPRWPSFFQPMASSSDSGKDLFWLTVRSSTRKTTASRIFKQRMNYCRFLANKLFKMFKVIFLFPIPISTFFFFNRALPQRFNSGAALFRMFPKCFRLI